MRNDETIARIMRRILSCNLIKVVRKDVSTMRDAYFWSHGSVGKKLEYSMFVFSCSNAVEENFVVYTVFVGRDKVERAGFEV